MNRSDVVVILVVGHNPISKGAKNLEYPKLNEYDINLGIAKALSARLFNDGQDNLIVLNGSVSNKVRKINSLDFEEILGKPKSTTVQVSLHFNAYKGYTSNSSGCEVLISNQKQNSARLADLLQREFSQIGNIDRGIKILSKGDRGYGILNETSSNFAVLCEPLFIDSEEGEMLEDPSVIGFLIEAYANGIEGFIEELCDVE